MKTSVRIASWLDLLERVDVGKQPAAARILATVACDPRPAEVAAAERAIAGLFAPGARIAYPPARLCQVLEAIEGWPLSGAEYGDMLDVLRIECGNAVLDEAEQAGEIRPVGRGLVMSLFASGLLIAAFILFVLAAFNVASPRVNLVALGLACAVLSFILRTL